MSRDTEKAPVLVDREQLIQDLQLLYPENKEQIPEMVDFMKTSAEFGQKFGYEAGWKNGLKAGKAKLGFRTFVAIFITPFLLQFGFAVAGVTIVGLVIAAAIGTTMFMLLDIGIESINKLLTKKD